MRQTSCLVMQIKPPARKNSEHKIRYPMKKNRVLILGGGFGRLYDTLEFEKRHDPDFEVTLISQDDFFLFTPMLHEVAASDLDLTHIVNPIRKMLRYVHFFEGEVR